MKILAVCGSPRKGNTEFMLKTVLDAARAKGAETELILLRDIKMEHCTGCATCMKQKTGKCIIEDDVNKILDKLFEADAIVLGSPTYFDDVTGLMKDFIDRMLPLYEFEKRKLKGKKAAIVVVGHLKLGEGSIERAADNLKNLCEIHEMKLVGKVVASSGEKKPAENKEVIAELKKLGESL